MSELPARAFLIDLDRAGTRCRKLLEHLDKHGEPTSEQMLRHLSRLDEFSRKHRDTLDDLFMWLSQLESSIEE